MAMTAKHLPRAMLIDGDSTILSRDGRPEITRSTIATEFASELAPLPRSWRLRETTRPMRRPPGDSSSARRGG